MADTCTCARIVVGTEPHPTARNLNPSCPMHGVAAWIARVDAMDPVVDVREAGSAAARFALLKEMIRAECERGAPRKGRLRDIATAAAQCEHDQRRVEIAAEQEVRRG